MVAKSVMLGESPHGVAGTRRLFATSYGLARGLQERGVTGGNAGPAKGAKGAEEDRMSNKLTQAEIDGILAENRALKEAVKAANGFSFQRKLRKDPKTKAPISGDYVLELKVGNHRPERHKPSWWATVVPAVVEHHEAMLKLVVETEEAKGLKG